MLGKAQSAVISALHWLQKEDTGDHLGSGWLEASRVSEPGVHSNPAFPGCSFPF